MKDKWEIFKALAKSEGYTKKVYGDYAFMTIRRKNGYYGYIKLWGSVGEAIIVSFTKIK